MHHHFASPPHVLGTLVVTASVAGLLSCAPPLRLSTAVPAPEVGVPAPADSILASEPATVQVRYFSFSPIVSVVAWHPTDAGYGLRGWIRRDGSLIRDHRIYVSTFYEPAVRAYPHAAVPPRVLLVTGISRDIYACYFGSCSPPETYGARIPDDLLRTNRDSVAVIFYGRGGRELTITLYRDVIDAYLTAVDSVSAALRSRS